MSENNLVEIVKNLQDDFHGCGWQPVQSREKIEAQRHSQDWVVISVLYDRAALAEHVVEAGVYSVVDFLRQQQDDGMDMPYADQPGGAFIGLDMQPDYEVLAVRSALLTNEVAGPTVQDLPFVKDVTVLGFGSAAYQRVVAAQNENFKPSL